MHDQSFNLKTLSIALKRSDFIKHSYLAVEKDKLELLRKSVAVADKGFEPGISLTSRVSNGMTIYGLGRLEEELVIRHAVENIRHLTGVKQSDRNRIVSDLISLLKENVDCRIYKLDISSFFESIDTSFLLDSIERDVAISRPTFRVIATFFDALSGFNVSGVPRGISLSSILSERLMRSFDQYVKTNKEVFFYNRFVDDIIIITSSNEEPADFLNLLTNKLPLGLKFNSKKTSFYDIEYKTKEPNKFRTSFDYLGYVFRVLNPDNGKNKRVVEVDIADKKVRKIKTKCIKSCLDHIRKNNFDLLRKRFQFLTSNHTVYSPDEEMERLAGIYYNYRHVNLGSSASLKNLDMFVHSLILGGATKISSSLDGSLTQNNKRTLLKLSFSGGFKSRAIYSYSSAELTEIVRCWQHG